MNGTIYISAILPLKLEWEPCYSTEAKVSIGDRIKVAFANKVYRAVVSGVNITPDINPDKIRPVLSVETDIERILPSEIAFWRQVAEYYLCTVGEVYKAAYPSGKVNLEEARAAARQKAAKRQEKILLSIKTRIEKLEERLHKKEIQVENNKDTSRK